MRFVVATLLLLTAAGLCSAGSYYNGYVADGYTYQNGYWYSGSQAYTRTLYQRPGYWYYGVYYPGSYYYVYTAYTPPAPPAAKGDWRAEALRIKGKEKEYAGKFLLNAQEQQAYMDAIKALGLNTPGLPPIAPPAIAGGYSGYGGYGSYTYASYPVNATTQYGYSTASLYGANDINILFQALAKTQESAQQYLGQSTQGLLTLTGTAVSGNQRVAEILARGQVVAAVLAAPSKVETAQFRFTVTPAGTVAVDGSGVSPQNRAQVNAAWMASAQGCVACHTVNGSQVKGGKVNGGFDVSQYPSMSADIKQGVVSLTQTDDETRRMPKNGPKMDPSTAKLWLLVGEDALPLAQSLNSPKMQPVP